MTQSDASPLPAAVDELWWRRAELSPADTEARAVVVSAVDMLDGGKARVAEVSPTGEVVVDERARRAVMLAFRVLGMARSQVGDFHHHDRLPLKTSVDGVRVVPGAIARWGAYLARGVVLMPSFVDIGAHLDEGSTVDTWVSIGSCAQIGKNVHLAGGVGVGEAGGQVGEEGAGAPWEPSRAAPAVVEDGALIGRRAVIAEGARVGRGAVVGAGTILSGSTPVVDVRTGEELGRGRVPDWCVAAQGTRWREFPGGTFGLRCVLVLERLEEGHRPGRGELDRMLHGHG
ncbi:2,3,4,5-tetrahydropyridine-2,6-dicarboxylate N-succinyltransferase [Streptosporangium sp. NBC_01755]|uniref:2,3,4,5-tetrahydropyridine-2,6-dicarboxylate N-succinyltransferase n=1 Tax=unclassified Streptosporangium TaxID=2632669 RepID=UPI002DD9EC22|nr:MULTISPECIES: 2,3,4,5-tetrahydropyridine-2,6-dicarboxylate N-succinyltransferase [unclassified Streptosporangium]WSA26234.1 2,3,4,5-tetrahydropyridine-2,6-dicarboxylate N-succinyltransferase [Streptosporangium sp. NBC_01810]WSD02338.1 2,3,4,5-tetrahydropyridine-2,6-dicarboxylate N-succinyltransferase [Streptosporangium sp. NBC_01755]